LPSSFAAVTMPAMTVVPLLASAGTGAEARLVAVLGQLVVIILAARVAAAVARRVGQPAVVGEILAGLALGPSLVGRIPGPFHGAWAVLFHPVGPALGSLPDVFAVLSQLGLIFLLFLIGLEFDFAHLRTTRGASLSISVAGVVAPFTLGVGLAAVMFPYLSPAPVSRLGFALFMGTAMSITAIPILGRIMIEMNIARTRLGAVTITAAAADDAVGWVLLATVTALVGTGFSPGRTALMLAESAGFAVAMVSLAGPPLRAAARRAAVTGSLGLNALAVLLAVLFGCAIATSLIGIFAIFGAFLLGAVLSPEASFRRAVNDRLRDFVTAFFLPIFFTYTGLRTDVGSVGGPLMWLFAAAVIVLAVVGKFGGCALAARWSGMSGRESVLVGVMMNTRALMELIVVNVGRDLGVIPPSVFCMLVLMAIATTVMTAPVLVRGVRGTDLEPLVRRSGLLRPPRRRAA
jgi:Kef-type K+ transport system membrane component KefB